MKETGDTVGTKRLDTIEGPPSLICSDQLVGRSQELKWGAMAPKRFFFFLKPTGVENLVLSFIYIFLYMWKKTPSSQLKGSVCTMNNKSKECRTH